MRFNMLSESDSYLTQSVNKLELVSQVIRCLSPELLVCVRDLGTRYYYKNNRQLLEDLRQIRIYTLIFLLSLHHGYVK